MRMIIILSIYFSAAQLGLCQINTEIFRRDNSNQGFYAGASLSVDYESGNSNDIEYITSCGVGYSGDYVRSFASGFLKYKEGLDHKLITNKGHFYVNFQPIFSVYLNPEAFYQKNFNYFIRLKDRNLIGLNGRLRLLDSRFGADSNSRFMIFVSTGAMYEQEIFLPKDTFHGFETKYFKSTSSLNLTLKAGNFDLLAITYYQFQPDNTINYRILTDINLGFKIIDMLKFVVNLDYRYDNFPPQGIEKYDFGMYGGLMFEI